MGNAPPKLPYHQEEAVLGFDCSVNAIVRYIKEGRAQNIVCMCGAGISVSAGIPDFRTPGTGLYANLQKYNLPRPELMFDIEYFHENPMPFYDLARELYPDNFKPTPTHYFIKLLQDKHVLRRCYTQNIDTLERAAGIDPDLLVEAHGSFGLAHCVNCGTEHSAEYVKEQITTLKVCTCTSCSGFVKPDIVFFGENLPRRFSQMKMRDMPAADLLIVMGTSLKVAPFNMLVDECNPKAPRLLLNMERVNQFDEGDGCGFEFDLPSNYRDVELLSACDDGVRLICDLLGWRDELEDLITAGQSSSLSAEEHPIPLDSEKVARNYRTPTQGPVSEPQTLVPFISSLLEHEGTVNGQLSAFKDEQGKLSLYRWVLDDTQEKGHWEDVAPVDVPVKSNKQELDGEMYDMVVPVEVQSASRGFMEFQLGFNKDSNSDEIAQAFCTKHELGPEYVEQITSFVTAYQATL